MNRKPPLVNKVQAWLRSQSIGPGPMVVAVSGGPDSVALLRALATIRPPVSLTIAHLNHQLRGEESDQDEQFVRNLQTQLSAGASSSLSLHCRRIEVRASANLAGENLEATARALRYDWLVEVALASGAAFVATGHNLDDQAETVLHRVLRGTGLRGLCGIASRRILAPGIEVIRPLLGVSRAEILHYLSMEKQDFREDASNLDRSFTRNRIRHELLPALAREYNPAIRSVLAGLATEAELLFRETRTRAQCLLAEAERPRAGPLLVFDRASLLVKSSSLLAEVFHLVWEREQWPLGEMTRDHWNDLAQVVLGERTAAEFPGGVRVQGKDRVIQLSRTAPSS